VAAHPDVIDGAGLRAMYRAVGYQSCTTYGTECWETREAQAAERVVREQLRRFRAFARRRDPTIVIVDGDSRQAVSNRADIADDA